MKTSVAYSSCSCNRVPSCVTWGSNNLLLYGACHAVAVYDVTAHDNSGAVVKTLIHHNGRINSVGFSTKILEDHFDRDENFFVSAASDKNVVVWKKEDGKKYDYAPLVTLQGHSDIANIADSAVVSKNGVVQLLVASSGSDFSVFFWKLSIEGEILQTSQLHQKFLPLDVRFIPLKGQAEPLLALGCDDFKIHIFRVGSELEKLFQLVGHEDWIRSLDVTFDSNGDTLIASSSQDCLIRIWKVKKKSVDQEVSKLKISENTFKYNEVEYVASSESVLSGHENWVYGVNWETNVKSRNPRLLSASMDKTMILWEEEQGGVWMDSVRVGEVGGNTLGFFGCAFNPDASIILAHGFQGAFHMWRLDKETNQWLPRHSFGGHFAEVTDLGWDPEGTYVLSCSADQTTRLHGPWIQKEESPIDAPWFELARPQVHGHDLNCLALADRYRFISGAEEKVARAFEAPEDFVTNFQSLCCFQEVPDRIKNAPRGASVPALGLSNKPVYDTELSKEKVKPKSQSDMYQESQFTPEFLEAPPTEETLLQNTLWPEVQKLYGHGFELFALASNRSGTVLASSCKATKPEHAGIILWDQKTWTQITTLLVHNLTITQLCFSPDENYLLSVSRDRSWTLFKRSASNALDYIFCSTSTKQNGHSRIIWSCDWSPDSKNFATGSRDKTVRIWSQEGECWNLASSPLELEEPVTAVAFAPLILSDGSYLLAIGLENGVIHLYRSQHAAVGTAWRHVLKLEQSEAHHGVVKRLRFCPVVREKEGQNILQLASAGADHFVRINNIFIPPGEE